MFAFQSSKHSFSVLSVTEGVLRVALLTSGPFGIINMNFLHIDAVGKATTFRCRGRYNLREKHSN